MISIEVIIQIANLALTGVFAGLFHIAFFREKDDEVALGHRPRKSYVLWIGALFLSIGLLGALAFDRSITDSFLLKYFGFGSIGFCLFYSCCIAWLLACFRESKVKSKVSGPKGSGSD